MTLAPASRPLRTLGLAIAAAAALSGCVSTQTLSRESAASLRGQTLAVSARPDKAFSVTTPGRMGLLAFGIVGGLAHGSLSEQEGREIVKQHGLREPAASIAPQLAKTLQSQWGMRPSGKPVPVPDETDPQALAAAARGQARYLLDVRTLFWEMRYISATQYSFVHKTAASLIDTQSGQLISQGSCERQPPTSLDEKAPTHEQMLANGAAVLKQQVQQAASDCVAKLLREMFPQ